MKVSLVTVTPDAESFIASYCAESVTHRIKTMIHSKDCSLLYQTPTLEASLNKQQ